MKFLNKLEFEALSLENLELEKQRMMKKVLSGKEAKKHRNLLYELLGVIEWKKRFDLEIA